jgi:hypothetical protein
MPDLLHLHINKLTLSIMCVKDKIAKKTLIKENLKWLIMCAKTINYFFIINVCRTYIKFCYRHRPIKNLFLN